MSGRELQPGDAFFSALIEEKNGLRRLDVAPEHWIGPPDEGQGKNELPRRWVGWWKTSVPVVNEKKTKLAPNEILLNLFEQLRLQGDQPDRLYVLTLLLIRRRLMRYEREEEDESGRKILVVYNLKDNATFEILITMPDEERLDEVQQQLAQLLYH